MLNADRTYEETARLGEALYERELRARLEADLENVGKILVLDVESGDYEIDETGIPAARRLQARRPDARLYALRIGYDVVYALDGKPAPTKQ